MRIRLKRQQELLTYLTIILAIITGLSIPFYFISGMESSFLLISLIAILLFILTGRQLYLIGNGDVEESGWFEDDKIFHLEFTEKKEFESSIHVSEIKRIILIGKEFDIERVLIIKTSSKKLYFSMRQKELLEGLILRDFFTKNDLENYYDSDKKKIVLFQSF